MDAAGDSVEPVCLGDVARLAPVAVSDVDAGVAVAAPVPMPTVAPIMIRTFWGDTDRHQLTVRLEPDDRDDATPEPVVDGQVTADRDEPEHDLAGPGCAYLAEVGHLTAVAARPSRPRRVLLRQTPDAVAVLE
jgi:hypothetical protein